MSTLLFLISLVICILAFARVSNTSPVKYSIDRFDDDFYSSEDVSDYRPIRQRDYNSRGLRHERADAYYDGYYQPSYDYDSRIYPDAKRQSPSINRRTDRDSENAPEVKHKSTRTKRKKLFVPNLFG